LFIEIDSFDKIKPVFPLECATLESQAAIAGYFTCVQACNYLYELIDERFALRGMNTVQ